MTMQSIQSYHGHGKIAGKIRRPCWALRGPYREKRESSYLITLYLSLSPVCPRESTRGGDPHGKNGKIRRANRNTFTVKDLWLLQSCHCAVAILAGGRQAMRHQKETNSPDCPQLMDREHADMTAELEGWCPV